MSVLKSTSLGMARQWTTQGFLPQCVGIPLHSLLIVCSTIPGHGQGTPTAEQEATKSDTAFKSNKLMFHESNPPWHNSGMGGVFQYCTLWSPWCLVHTK